MNHKTTTHGKKEALEASYIPLAKRVLTAQRLKEQARTDEIAAKRSCASAMNAFHVKQFSVNVEGQTYQAKLERKERQRINTRKLYVLLSSGEITLDEFFDCIVAPIEAVSETLGKDRVRYLLETYKTGLDLTFTPTT